MGSVRSIRWPRCRYHRLYIGCLRVDMVPHMLSKLFYLHSFIWNARSLHVARSLPTSPRRNMDRPFLWAINHLKLATTNIRRTQEFYCDIMGMEYLTQYDCYDQHGQLVSAMIRLKHTEEYATLIELRYNESQALAQMGMDPITYAVRSRESLKKWKSWFEQHGVRCSQIYAFQTLNGWAVSASDPDGRVVKIYCDEKHDRVQETEVHDF